MSSVATGGASSDAAGPEELSQREEFTDFALVLKDGRELKCHKILLGRVSPFFSAMLRNDCVETQTGRMKVLQFEPDTVETFLDSIYADLKLAPPLDEKRVTLDLLKMCHMYGLKSLHDRCAGHLKRSIDDTNVVETWVAAESLGNEELKQMALDHLKKKGNKILDVPGIKDSFCSPQLVESLVSHLTLSPRPSSGDDVITVHIVHIYGCYNFVDGSNFSYLGAFKVKPSNTVETLQCLVDDHFGESGKCTGLFNRNRMTSRLPPGSTLQSLGVKDGMRLFCKQ